VIQNIEQSASNNVVDFSAYAPSKLDNGDVKNSSSISQRLLPFCFAFGLHVLFLWWLNSEFEWIKKYSPDEVITVLEFLQPPSASIPVVVMPDVQQVPVRTSVKPLQTVSPVTAPNEKIINSRASEEKPSGTLKIYDDLGRIKLPVDFVEKLDEANRPSKRFDFKNPDLELAGTFLKRPPAIDFNPTQFEQAWKPDQDVLTELLEKAVEKTTKEIKIPVPGNPTVKLVCVVSIIAAGGSCGFVPNGGYGRVIPDNEDDPNTLSPEEDKQCQAWWEKINSTKSQREWIKTTELYELTCKKPLAKEKLKIR
jgi:hypothetical protein